MTYDLLSDTLKKSCEGQDWKYKQCLGELCLIINFLVSDYCCTDIVNIMNTAKFFNSLSFEIQNATSITAFSRKLKSFL